MSRANPRFKRNNATLPLFAPLTSYRVTVFYLADGQTCLWNMDYIMSNAAQTNSSEANILTSFAAGQKTQILAALAADCQLTSLKCQCLNLPSRQPAYTIYTPGSQPGSVAGNHIPLEMAAIISKLTFTKGQHGRGRLYLPGIPSSFITPATDANRLNFTGITAVAALTTTLTTTGVTDGAGSGSIAVTTRVLKGLPTLNGQNISSLTARALLGTIRRRRIGRGK